MNRTAFLCSVVLTALLVLPAVLQGQESGCISCHTDEARIQELFVPPDIDFKADEGEG